MKLTHFEFRDYAVDPDTNKVWKAWIVWGSIIGVGIIFLLCGCREPIYASEITYTNEQLAQAIYRVEGGAKTRHPYGILAKYKTTTPRQACLNTIKSAKRRYEKSDKSLDFVSFLGRTYCPVGASNDPMGLNKNWVFNVKWWLKNG